MTATPYQPRKKGTIAPNERTMLTRVIWFGVISVGLIRPTIQRVGRKKTHLVMKSVAPLYTAAKVSRLALRILSASRTGMMTGRTCLRVVWR